MKYSVIILCYKADLEIIIELNKIQNLLDKENIKYELILVCNYKVDDDDKTYEIIKNFVKESSNSNLFIIHEKKTINYSASLQRT